MTKAAFDLHGRTLGVRDPTEGAGPPTTGEGEPITNLTLAATLRADTPLKRTGPLIICQGERVTDLVRKGR